MENLTLKTAQPMLCRCLFGDTNDEHMSLIVPRQGNLLNPQQRMACSAYFTYYISRMRRALLHRTFGLEHVVTVVADIELQAVGLDAEEMMQSTLFWTERSDVKRILAEYDTQLMEDEREIVSTPFFQDGANTILAYNTTLSVVSAISCVDETDAERYRNLLLQGKLDVRS